MLSLVEMIAMQVDRPSAPSSPPFHAIRRVASHSGLSRSDGKIGF